MERNGHTYTLKSVKTFRDHEGFDITQGSIAVDGKTVGTYSEDSWGGPMMLDIPAEVEAIFRDFGIDGWREEYGEDPTFSGEAASWFVADLIKEWQEAKWQKALLRKATKQVVFVFDGDDPQQQYRSFPAKVAYMDAVTYLKTKYASKHPRILNGATGEWEAVA